MAHSLALAAYFLFTRHNDGLAARTLKKRLARGKEDPARIDERMGNPGLPRPDGPLIWIHAASVGESLSILELARRMLDARPDLHCLITTGTVTSAAALSGRMPDRMFHQYVPLDVASAVARFLEHWQPDLAVWTESELWPALLDATKKRDIAMVLVNARMSKRSYKRWKWLRRMASFILTRFDYALTQDKATAKYLENLGLPIAQIETTGSLKEGATPLPYNEVERKAFTNALGGRMLWLAASTHLGEEPLVATAHRQARRSFPELLLILTPRHPERGDEIAHMLRADGWNVAQRSKAQLLKAQTDIYLADTIAEMGLWYRLAPVSFLGGSLVKTGGHNPFEPAVLGSAILHGPHVFNFSDAFQRLEAAQACVPVADAGALAQKLGETLIPECSAKLATAAWAVCSEGADVTDRVLNVLMSYLPKADT